MRYVITAKANLNKWYGLSQRLKVLAIINDALTKNCSLPQKSKKKINAESIQSKRNAAHFKRHRKIYRKFGMGQLC